MSDEFLRNSMGVKIKYQQIRKAMELEQTPLYPMSLVGAEVDAVRLAVNQGIDSHLEACSIKERGDKYEWGDRRIGDRIIQTTLECLVSPESLPTLLRRLTEQDDEEGTGSSLAEGILMTLGFNDMGKYVGRDAVGL
jgi:hypothetical protein